MAHDDYGRQDWESEARDRGRGRHRDAWSRERSGYGRELGFGRERFAGDRESRNVRDDPSFRRNDSDDEYGESAYGSPYEYSDRPRGRASSPSPSSSPSTARSREVEGTELYVRALGPEAEWGAGYAGGYGRTGEYGERGGHGFWRGGAESGVGAGATESRSSRARGRANFAGVGPRGYRRSDERISDEINEALTRHPDIDASDVIVSVLAGHVTLDGFVDDRAAKHLAEDLAAAALGVSDVTNNLRIGTEPRTDAARRAISEREVTRPAVRADTGPKRDRSTAKRAAAPASAGGRRAAAPSASRTSKGSVEHRPESSVRPGRR